MNDERIVIKGAREHNLRSVNLHLPKNALICVTGVSGSGKSSLAFDTLYAEGQRRYLESLSSLARQVIGQLPKPDVDSICGLSPAISISQKSTSGNPRSTVGTLTEIYDYLRLLYARAGRRYCPHCGELARGQTRDEIVNCITNQPAGTRVTVLAPVVRHQRGTHRTVLQSLWRRGILRVRINGQIQALTGADNLVRNAKHSIDALVDEVTLQPGEHGRVFDAVARALQLAQGTVVVLLQDGENRQSCRELLFSENYSCAKCGVSFSPTSPQLFSFNSPHGMCPNCEGLGKVELVDPSLIVVNPKLPLLRGALYPTYLEEQNVARTIQMRLRGIAASAAARCNIFQEQLSRLPWEQLGERMQRLVLYGSIADPNRGPTHDEDFAGYLNVLTDAINGQRAAKDLPHLADGITAQPCPVCQGDRLRVEARSVRLTTASEAFSAQPELSLPEVCRLPIDRAAEFFAKLVLDDTQQLIVGEVLKEIQVRLRFLQEVGLGYLSLHRDAPSLSGGEAQRIRLASQIGSGLVGVLYVLDEPSIGLHPRDNRRLLAALKRLRDLGNTVVVVEHDEDTMRHADWIVDFGPGAGGRGGQVVAAGTLRDICKAEESITGQYLSKRRTIAVPSRRRKGNGNVLRVVGATHNNLKNITVDFPLGTFICVTGVSGSGKSSLINDILVEALNRELNHGSGRPGKFQRLEGLKHLDRMIAIDQSPIGRTPRSNPGTYVKVFDEIRKLFTELPEARRRGFAPGRFSFNVEGGRCEACEGAGARLLEMGFLADVWVPCPVCQGKRFNRETLQVRYKGYSIADVLAMDVATALDVFSSIPAIRSKLATLQKVGLDYLQLGQPSPSLSGGEAQRIKLARELSKRSTGRTIYLLDEPTTGLHFADIERLLDALHQLVDAGNTVVVVEHNLDVIKTADWIIDLGPEGGEAGGFIVALGTPEELAQVEQSHTGRHLRDVLAPALSVTDNAASVPNGKPATQQQGSVGLVRVRKASQHNLKQVDVDIPHRALTVLCGPSGSGKTSLALDTIYAEGQRRYVESLSTYARQFVSQMPKAQVERIDGLSPAIALEQKKLGNNPRSTVGTVTEIYDYLRILFARLGTPYCPTCEVPVGTQTADDIADQILKEPEGTLLMILAPVATDASTNFDAMWAELRAEGFLRVRVNRRTYTLESVPKLDPRVAHQVEVVVDRWQVRTSDRSRLIESLETALNLGEGVLRVAYPQENCPESRWPVVTHSVHLACRKCGRSFDRLQPQHFSFNSRLGWCPACAGLGVYTGVDPEPLLDKPSLSLAEGVMLLWPQVDVPLARRMLQALCQGTGIPADVPYENLPTRYRRLLWHGTGDQWFEVRQSDDADAPVWFRFQYRGVHAALEYARSLGGHIASAVNGLLAERVCLACEGSRLRDDAAAVRFYDKTIGQLCRLTLSQLHEELQTWQLTESQQMIGSDLIRELRNRVQFLLDVGLHYLTLERAAETLSCGEAQRIRLARQLGSNLSGVLYVLDEPTIGLHPRDNRRLIAALHRLRDLGNTIVVVEHDREVIRAADKVIDFGPAAGLHGGYIVAQGPPEKLATDPNSVTGPYLSGAKRVWTRRPRRLRVVGPRKVGECPVLPLSDVEHREREGECPVLRLQGVRHHNLKNITVEIPQSCLVAVTGPSGSGKSSLVHDVLYARLARVLHKRNITPGAYDRLTSNIPINKVILVDQEPIGTTPHATPVTYTGVFDSIRGLFARTREAQAAGLQPLDFSFNYGKGRCTACEGQGQRRVEMHFMPDVWIPCPVCQGSRYSERVQEVRLRGKSIGEVLKMTFAEAAEFFADVKAIQASLRFMCDVGLGYLTLGQPAPSLSGGESQRLKLVTELSRPAQGHTLYLLDEPTTGLHFADVQRLIDVLQRLVDKGHTVIVVEHNLDLIQACDWIVDLGPEAGEEGGYVVAAGTPEHVAGWAIHARTRGVAPTSATGEFLADILAEDAASNVTVALEGNCYTAVSPASRLPAGSGTYALHDGNAHNDDVAPTPTTPSAGAMTRVNRESSNVHSDSHTSNESKLPSVRSVSASAQASPPGHSCRAYPADSPSMPANLPEVV